MAEEVSGLQIEHKVSIYQPKIRDPLPVVGIVLCLLVGGSYRLLRDIDPVSPRVSSARTLSPLGQRLIWLRVGLYCESNPFAINNYLSTVWSLLFAKEKVYFVPY